jgi:hypothetical protein
MAEPPGIVGAWEVTTTGAPFAHHMFVFHADGTLLQFNPPAGNPGSSDTPGVGAWRSSGDGETRARFVEVRLDPASGVPTRGVVDFRVRVAGDRLSGTGAFHVYDMTGGKLVDGPHSTTFEGRRVTVPADDLHAEPV